MKPLPKSEADFATIAAILSRRSIPDDSPQDPRRNPQETAAFFKLCSREDQAEEKREEEGERGAKREKEDKRGNSLETPNVWGLSSFHPNVSKQPPPPQCLGFCLLFTPRLLSCRAGSDVDATGSSSPDAEATSLPCHHKAKQKLVACICFSNSISSGLSVKTVPFEKREREMS